MADPVARIGELLLHGALDATAWDDGLALLTGTLGADHFVAAVSGASGTLGPSLSHSVAWGYGAAAEHIDACSRYPSDVIKLSQLLTTRVTAQNETVPFPVFSQMGIFNGAIRNMGGRHAAVARIAPRGFVAACRGHARRAFSDSEKDMLTALLPSLSSAIAIKQQLRALHSHAAMLEAAFDSVATGVIFLDRHRRVIHANAVGEALINSADALCATAAGLCATTARENERLGHAVTECSGKTVLIRRSSGWPLAIRAVKAPTRTGAAATTILFVNDPRRPMRNRLAGICAALELTRRETDISEFLAAGTGASEIATALGITIGNLRGHLNRIFAKAGVGSQAQLVALLLSASS